MCGPWCPDGDVLHFGVHSIDVCLVGVFDPFLGSLSNFVLNLLLSCLGFTTCGDVLDVSHDTIHERCFSPVIGRALGSVMARLVTFETGDRCRVSCFASVVLRGMVWAVSGLTCRRGVRPFVGRVVPRLGVWERPTRFGVRRFFAMIVIGLSIIALTVIRVTLIVP